MKKIMFAAVAASIAGITLAGCSGDEVLSEKATSASNAIGFHLTGSNASVTRATPIHPNTITSTDFDVFAITASGKNFMGFPNAADATTPNHDGVKIQFDKESGKWTYANPNEQAYWPSEALDFYAVSPAEGANDRIQWLIKPESQLISYVCIDEFEPSVAKQGKNVDVMYATAKGQTKQSNGGKVVMDFKHALSQVVFKARISENQPGLKVEIKKVVVGSFYAGGTFTFPTAEKEASWTPAEPHVPNGFLAYKESADPITVNSTTDAVWLSDEDDSMMMIPQTLTPWDVTNANYKSIDKAKQADQSYLAIYCKIYQNGTLLDGFSADSYSVVYIPFGATLKAGYRHIFTLVFGGGYDQNGNPILTPIVIEGDMTQDWIDDAADKAL